MQHMRAAVVVEGRIEIEDRPTPVPGTDEVLVRVVAAGLNRADLIQRMGLYPAPPGSPPDIPGLEFSGVIEALGTQTVDHGLHVADRVFGITGGGAQAEYVVVPAPHCAKVPEPLDLVAAGGVPEAFVTAHDAMITQAGLRSGEWMLVHAVGSGVGTTALQLANAFGATVIGTARQQHKLDQCAALGLRHGIVAPTDADGRLDVLALRQQILEIVERGVDVTLDLVGGSYLEAEIASSAPGGRIVLIGTLAGGRASFDILGAMQRRLAIHGTVLRPRSVADKAAATDAFVRDVVPLLAAGTVAPIIEQVIALEEAQGAYDLLASDATFGKLVLDCR